jgi:CRISPR-associated protein Cas5t
MRAYRIAISSWTSSFRYPNIISGYQPTLLVPPISTVLGVFNACAGKYIKFDKLDIGYYFDYKGKSTDLETIYQVELNKKGIPKLQVKPNVINRDILSDCRLFIYFIDNKYIEIFKSPFYQILLGRSNDLATIDKIEEIELKETSNADKIKGQIVPFTKNHLPGTLQALPKYFTNTIPRNNIGTEAYSIIPFNADDFQTSIIAYRDSIDENDVDIYFHKLDFADERCK